MSNRVRRCLWPAALLLALAFASAGGADDRQEILSLTEQFCKAMERADLAAIDQIFDPAQENVFYDINEGPLDFERLKRVWRAATTNYKLSRFVFKDTKVELEGDRALQTGTWEQTQENREGVSRNITGRATVLWKKTPSGWRVYHYHASVTPTRPAGSRSRSRAR